MKQWYFFWNKQLKEISNLGVTTSKLLNKKTNLKLEKENKLETYKATSVMSRERLQLNFQLRNTSSAAYLADFS